MAICKDKGKSKINHSLSSKTEALFEAVNKNFFFPLQSMNVCRIYKIKSTIK